ncbi:MAG TPA: hypothetical protein VFJ58_08420 [Armatimonadota bacterium]|nr:hypothetical protein [Armatimonadota bacterium]
MPGLDPNDRWLPPSPHREKLLEIVAKGRGHIEEQGHGLPPLLVYEDGGTMELPLFRWIDGEAVAGGGSDPGHRTTHFLDVCGSIDELKRILTDDPGIASRDPARLNRLLEDALYMIHRMDRRLEQYHDFCENVESQIRRMELCIGVDWEPAEQSAAIIRQALTDRPAAIPKNLKKLFEEAEKIRNVASGLEEALYLLRDACIEIFTLYEEVRGARQWKMQPPATNEPLRPVTGES